VNWHDKSILVLGAGDTGVSVVRWAVGMGARVRIADTRDDPPGAAELAAECPACDLVTGPFSAALFGDAELVVASPGVAVAGPACDAAVARAIAQGKKFVGDVELFAWEQDRLARQGQRPKMIGITGSNGKSTVTAMTGEMCRAAGANTVVAGNIGLPVLDAARQAREPGGRTRRAARGDARDRAGSDPARPDPTGRDLPTRGASRRPGSSTRATARGPQSAPGGDAETMPRLARYIAARTVARRGSR